MADLFGSDNHDWKAEWVGMPEFVQEPDKPYQTLTVRFRNAEDVQAFAELIGQRITPLTKSLWVPVLVRGVHGRKRYVAEP